MSKRLKITHYIDGRQLRKFYATILAQHVRPDLCRNAQHTVPYIERELKTLLIKNELVHTHVRLELHEYLSQRQHPGQDSKHQYISITRLWHVYVYIMCLYRIMCTQEDTVKFPIVCDVHEPHMKYATYQNLSQKSIPT